MLTNTYSKRDETGNDWVGYRNPDWSNILQWREVIQFHILRLFQERLNASLKFASAKDCAGLWIRTFWSG